MFKKILITEDIDTVSQGIMVVMDALQIDHVQTTQYCDDAYLKVKKASLDGAPFELLITDLFFAPDHRKQKITSGEDLIKMLKEEFPELNIIVFSSENRPGKIRSLFKDLQINGFVSKGRKGLKELEEAILAVREDGCHLSSEMQRTLKSEPQVEIRELDVKILQLLSEGYSQDEISHYFKENEIKPGSLSAIEKRLNFVRNLFGAKTIAHLIAITKDQGII